MKYPKIHSLWKRQQWYLEDGKKNNNDYKKGRQSFIIGDYAVPEFGNIKKWLVQEKIDGTNIRINFALYPNIEKSGNSPDYIPGVVFGGRTDDSVIPNYLYEYLTNTFTSEKLQKIFPHHENNSTPVIWLFGEGYGPKIQKAGVNYRNEVAFILFDVKINDLWMPQDLVKEIASKLEIEYAPIIGIMTEDEIVEYIKSKPLSLCSITPQIMEGIVARPEHLILFSNGDPIMMKLKCKEF